MTPGDLAVNSGPPETIFAKHLLREVRMASSRHAPGRIARASLRRGLGLGLAVALLTGAGLQGAAAQGFYREVYGPPRGAYFNDDDGLLPPREIVEGLHERGFSEVGRPRFDGRAYRVEATSPRGMRVRLVVDAREGDVLGREPLGVYYPSDRVRPAAPGYGWTEEDMRPRRQREAERIVPPADIPSVPGLRNAPLGPEREAPRPLRAERVPPAVRPEANLLGVNPDAATARPEAPRRAARPAPAAVPASEKAKPAQARITPPAPEPSLRSGQAATPEVMPAARQDPAKEAKAAEPPANPSKLDAAPAPAKESPRLPSRESGKESAKESGKEPPKEPAKTADSAPAPAKPGWQDPPADGPRKNVRVIGGATVVPGGSGEAAGN